ncbi:protein TIFY 8-like [Camellia sinensis]|uniref:protein TIFY 8-like n=1 Tax=Camellia sinensis TaxID=4442 RepID=UPI001035EAB6|nr:protein TIFY 8-like [Camellia sinensis]
MNNRFAGNKQSNLDSAFMGSSRDGFPQVGPESLDGLHLMKILRNVGGEKPRRSHDEAMFFAVDEESHTRIKGSGILSSINASNEVSERNPSGVLLPGGKQKSGTHNSEPESLTPRPSQHGSISSSRQMTIFHGGQAHVFDDIHSNKVRKPAGLKTNGYLLVNE